MKKDEREGRFNHEKDGPALDDQYAIAAYIASFLSKFVAPGKPNDCQRRVLFSLAARLFIGGRPGIPEFILGYIYHWLDQFHDDLIRSDGLCDVGNYALTPLLMAFLYERFPKYAPTPNNLDEETAPGVEARITRWLYKRSKKNLSEIIDEEIFFAMRPYAQTHSYHLFKDTEWVYGDNPDLNRRELEKDTVAPTMAVVIPFVLPFLDDSGYSYVAYNPHRYARQFGFDQVVPKVFFESGNDDDELRAAAWGGFSPKEVVACFFELDGYVIPSAMRVGRKTERYGLF